ncbi:hypothetical protein NDA13_004895 [Ustilago tritici]|nr:hypothetical protein NDA13_004895 [Ustilago tritici]
MPVEAPPHEATALTLFASVSDVTGLANLLKSVAIQTHAVIIASSSGLEIVTELNRTLQAHAYLYSHMFDSYTFSKPTTSVQNGNSSRPRTKRPQCRKTLRTSRDQDEIADAQSQADSDDQQDERTPNASPTPETARNRSQRAAGLDEYGHDGDANDEEPASVSFEVNLQTWISCLNIFGGVGPSRPHGTGSGHSNLRNDAAGVGSSASHRGRGYGRTRDGTVEPYGGGDRGGSVERGFDRNHFSSTPKATRMKLSYQGHGHPLVLELEQEANVVTRCSISTYEPSFLTDMIFDPRSMVAQVIVGSDLMQSAFSEIDASCKKLSILMTSPHSSSTNDEDADLSDSLRSIRGSNSPKSASMLRFKAISDTGSSEMDFPASLSSADPTGVIEKFIALPGSTEQWYDFTLLSRTMTVLRSSIKTSLRMDEAGLISFQFMMPKYRRTAVQAAAFAAPGPAAGQAALEEEQDAFCEFLCCPLDTSTLIQSETVGQPALCHFRVVVDGGPILAAAKPAASKDQKDLCWHCSVSQDDPLKELLIFVASMAAGGQVAGQL